MIRAFVLLTTLQASLTYAWSYNILRKGNPPSAQADFQGIKVLSESQPCTSFIDVGDNGEVDPVIGLQIYQYSPQTPSRQWARPVKYIGLWGDERCRGMPRYIVHWYDMVDTVQTLLFDTILRRSSEWEDPDTLRMGFNSWGEIEQGDELLSEQVPQGGVVVMAAIAADPGEWENQYLLLKNAISLNELVSERRGVPQRTDIKWDDYGSGTMEDPEIIRLTKIKEKSIASGGGNPNNRRATNRRRPPPYQARNEESITIDENDDEDSDEEVQMISRKMFKQNAPSRRRGKYTNAVPVPVQRKPPILDPRVHRDQVEEPLRDAQRPRRKNKMTPQEDPVWKSLQRKALDLEKERPLTAVEKKLLEQLLGYWVKKRLPGEALFEILKRLEDPIFYGLFQLVLEGRGDIKYITEYIMRLYKDIQEAEERERLAVQNNQEFLQRLVQGQAQTLGQFELLQRLALTQAVANSLTKSFTNPYMGENMNFNPNIGGMSMMYGNPGVQSMFGNPSGHNIFSNPGSQSLFGGTGSQNMFGNQPQMLINPQSSFENQQQTSENLQQLFGNLGGQPRTSGTGGWAQQRNSQINQSPLAVPNPLPDEGDRINTPPPFSNIEIPTPINQSPRMNHMPIDKLQDYLGAPPNTPFDPKLFNAGTNDVLTLLRTMPDIIAQLPGFQGSGELGGVEGLTTEQLNEINELLAIAGHRRRSRIIDGGATLAQMNAGMNARTGQIGQQGMRSAEGEGEDDIPAKIEEDI